MTDKQNENISKTILTSSAGNIVFDQHIGGTTMTLTHPNGSNTQYGNYTTSNFNSGNSQTLTMRDKFETVYGDDSLFVRGFYDMRVEGDMIEFVGDSSMLQDDKMEEWYKIYGEGYGSLKSQWNDTRLDLEPSDYPINTVFNSPTGMSDIVVCPTLLNGTAENNKDDDSRKEFEKQMMDVEEIKNSEQTKNLQQELSSIYDNIENNLTNYYNTKYKK